MRWVLLPTIFVVLLVFGCTGDLGSLFFRDREGSTDTGGLEAERKGVEFRFLPGAPPPEVFVGEPFNVEVEVANLGEGRFIFDEVAGKRANRIYFDGISFTDFRIQNKLNSGVATFCAEGSDFSCSDNSFILKREDFEPSVRIGKRYSTGGSRIYSLELLYDSFVLDEQEFNINAKECYSYQMVSNAKVCVSYGREGRGFRGRGCASFREVLANNQVGPIKVVSVVQSGYKQVGGDILLGFKIKVKDFGGGKSYINIPPEGGGEDVLDCRSLESSEEGFVFLDGEFLAGGEVIELDCTQGEVDKNSLEDFGIKIDDSSFNDKFGSMGIVRLFNGEGEINCKAVVPASVGVGLYEENMRIDLAYLYTTSESKSFKVKAGN